MGSSFNQHCPFGEQTLRLFTLNGSPKKSQQPEWCNRSRTGTGSLGGAQRPQAQQNCTSSRPGPGTCSVWPQKPNWKHYPAGHLLPWRWRVELFGEGNLIRWPTEERNGTDLMPHQMDQLWWLDGLNEPALRRKSGDLEEGSDDYNPMIAIRNSRSTAFELFQQTIQWLNSSGDVMTVCSVMEYDLL